MNNNCLSAKDVYSSPLLTERNKRLGQNFLYTVAGFALLCLLSYVING